MAATLLLFGAVLAWVWHVNLQDDPLDSPAAQVSPPVSAPVLQSAQIDRGAYLARVGNCAACHTARGGAPYAGGRALDTPFGVVYSSNLTPDLDTGLGHWTSADFWRALHHGRGRDGRLLVPAFPYTNFSLVTRDDVQAMWAYFQTLAPVTQVRPAHGLRFPYNTQWALAIWRALFFANRVSPQVSESAPSPSTSSPSTLSPSTPSSEWQRGAYLAQGLGHCSACHGARNVLGAVGGPDQGRSNFSGAVMADSGWYAPALNLMAEGGVAHWQPSEVVQWFKTGVNAHANATGPMAQVVLTSTQHWTDADLQALSAYLRGLPGLPGQTPPTVNALPPANPLTLRGAQVYDKQCADCHGARGEGAKVGREAGAAQSTPTVWAYPPLAGNRAVTQASSVNLVRLLRGGGFAPATAGNPRPYGMPPFDLADDDMAAVVSYIRSAWGNRAAPVTAVDVRVEK